MIHIVGQPDFAAEWTVVDFHQMHAQSHGPGFAAAFWRNRHDALAAQLELSVSHHQIDFVFIDTEHIALDRKELSWMCQVYAGLGLPPLVRKTL